MKDLTKQLQQRLKLIEQRLSALEKERTLLINEHDHVVALIEQYDTTSSYYDTIEEERNITKVFVPDFSDKFTITEYERKPVTNVNIEQVLALAKGLGSITVDDVIQYFDNPPSRATISRWFNDLKQQGCLSRVPNTRPIIYHYVRNRKFLSEDYTPATTKEEADE